MGQADIVASAKRQWENGSALEAGKLLFETLPAESHGLWAIGILELANQWIDSPIAPAKLLVRLKNRRWCWFIAHSIFNKIRDHTLRMDRRRQKHGGLSNGEEFLLAHCLLAEQVAKVVYNSTHPIDEFDEDSGWWVVACLRAFADHVANPQFEQEATGLLFTDEVQRC